MATQYDNEYPNQIKQFIQSHGFDAFINSNNSISWWLPDSNNDETLITVDSFSEARVSLGY